MKTALTLLDDIQIASPCPARWEEMTGDDRSRHCTSCDRTVYDLSRLTAGQAADLIREKEGRLCVRLFRRADGRVLTADCPAGLGARLRQFGDKAPGWLRGGWMIALFVWSLVGWPAVYFFSRATCETTMGEPAIRGTPPPLVGGQPAIGPDREELPPPMEER